MFTPILQVFDIPTETAPILFLRPFSGSGALAMATEIMQTYGVDSHIGRTAAVMLGSTETTFYVLTVYLAGVGHSRVKGVLPAALLADLVGFVMAAVTVNWWF
jgi:spore maturation protein B